MNPNLASCIALSLGTLHFFVWSPMAFPRLWKEPLSIFEAGMVLVLSDRYFDLDREEIGVRVLSLIQFEDCF